MKKKPSRLFQTFIDHTETYGLEIQCAMKGPEDAKIAIIGEYPGENEVVLNTPFVGASGKYLWNALRKFGILRTDCYTTNVVKRRVNSKYKVPAEEFDLWKEALEFELEQIPTLEYIVCLGNAAMNAVLNLDGITKHRGSVYDYKQCKVLCANNPAAIIRNPSNEIIFMMDIDKLNLLIKGDYEPHRIKEIINPTFQEAVDYIDYCQYDAKQLAGDIETIAYETACFGLAPNAHEAMCINLRTQHDHTFTPEQEYKLLRRLGDCLDDPNVWTVFQNGNFDSTFMGIKDHLAFDFSFDTLLAHHTLYPRLPHNLGFLTAQYTNHPYYKDEKDLFKEGVTDINQFWKYNCKDAAITMAVAIKEKQELIEQGLYDFFTTFVMNMEKHLIKATVDGEAVDLELRDQINNELKQEVDQKNADFQKAIRIATNNEDAYVNPNSPKQLTKLLFDDLGCNYTRRSADVHAREAIVSDPRTSIETKDVLLRLGDYLTEHKFYSTYVNTQLDEDNRFRAIYKQYGVQKAPGRLSSSGTLWGTGGNAQNQPPRAMPMFVADEGLVYIYFDLSQAEARYVGWDANIEKWKEDFERARIDGSYDAHRALAADMFGMDYELVPIKDIDPETGEYTIRYIAKRCRHGLNYRMHIFRLAQTTGLSYGQAAYNYGAYHKTNPEIQKWWKELEKEVKLNNGMLFNCFGRRLFITERLDNDDALESVVAFKPQSSIGDKVKRVWAQCHEDDKWDVTKAVIRRNVHDALWGVSKPAYAKTALSIMKKYAEEPLMIKSTMTGKVSPLIIPADTKLSFADETGMHRMSNMKEVEIQKAA